MGALAAATRTGTLTATMTAFHALRREDDRVSAAAQEIERIYREYGAMVRRRCLSILGNPHDAEDAMQEVFIRVLRSIGAFRGQSSPATWLYRIATNICLNRIRDARNRERLDKEVLEPAEPTDPVESWPRDLALRVMAGFDEATRETVVYAAVEGMTYDEIAQVMGCSLSLVRKRVARFKDKAPKRAARLLQGGRR
jgi:RNA polymerase sigma-70 factor (ECF subfamily)